MDYILYSVSIGEHGLCDIELLQINDIFKDIFLYGNLDLLKLSLKFLTAH